MKITAISDLHGEYPQLEGGDLLIVAGDLTASDQIIQYDDFYEWLKAQNYTHKVIIAGNHDNQLVNDLGYSFSDDQIYYLQDSSVEIEGLKIWGSPRSLSFEGIHPHCTAFTGSEEDLERKFKLIPRDTNILITHCPPHGILDRVRRSQCCAGSIYLRNIVLSDYFTDLKLHVFGHIHEHGGKVINTSTITFVNASLMNEDYEPVNKPVNIKI